MDDKSKYYREIKEKRNILRDRYGGMMKVSDLMKEFGYADPRSAKNVVEMLGIPPTKAGRLKKYDTDLVAKALVDRRGMA